MDGAVLGNERTLSAGELAWFLHVVRDDCHYQIKR
jgi:hypothetical protein